MSRVANFFAAALRSTPPLIPILRQSPARLSYATTPRSDSQEPIGSSTAIRWRAR